MKDGVRKARATLQLLGRFELAVDGEPLAGLTSEKLQALVAYLAVEQEHSHSRGFLAELLWPDRPAGVARQNLRQTLSRFQRALPPETPAILAIERHQLGFVQTNLVETSFVQPDKVAVDGALIDGAIVDEVAVDLNIFLAALAAVRNHRHSSAAACTSCCQRLATAVTHYQGELLADLFCDSPAFDEWLLLKREWLRQEVLWALDLLVQQHAAAANWPQSHAYAWRRVEIDPLLEEAHQQVMHALAHSGRKAEALAQYEQLRQLLENELGVEPAAASTALYNEIRAEQLVPPATEKKPAAPPAVPHNLPSQQTPFVGRAQELQQIDERLAQTECHLLTLIGPGGVGKTRLALAAAEASHRRSAQRYVDGIYFVALATAEDDDQVLTTLAAAIGYQFPDEAKGRAARLTALCHHLQTKRLLLLLDNLEQVAESTEIPTAILAAAPQVQLLVTSRVPLHLHAEWLLDIAGLDYPPEQTKEVEEPQRSLATFEAVQFFTTATQRLLAAFALSDQTLPVVGHLCRLTQGMPLALELAAAQMRAVPLPVLVHAVQQNMDTLATTMRDVPERHRSMRAVFEHSWHLLRPLLQQLFRQLSVFRGPFTADAAIAITGCSASALDDLCAASLLRQAGSDGYAMHAVLHQYAAEALQARGTEALPIHRQHSHYYLQFVGGAAEALSSNGAAQSAAQVHAAFDNIREGWQWAVTAGEWSLIRQALQGLLRFFVLTSQIEEGGQLCDRALNGVTHWLAAAAGAPPAVQRAQQLLAELYAMRARLFFKQARYRDGKEAAQQALIMAEAHHVPRAATLANLYWGICLLSQGEYAAADEKLRAALQLAQTHGWRQQESDSLRALGILADQQGNLPEARHFYEAALVISKELDDPRGASAALGNVGSICRQQGDFGAARQFLEESMAIHRQIGDRSSEGRTLTHLGELYIDLEEYAEAEACLGAAVETLRELGEEHYMADALVVLGDLYRQQGQIPLAVACWEQAEPIYVAANETPQLTTVRNYLQAVERSD